MLDWLRARRTRKDRALAWLTQVTIAECEPLVSTLHGPPRDDPRSLVSQAVYDSEAVHAALLTMADNINPRRPLTVALADTLPAVCGLLALRPSWRAYANEHFSLEPDSPRDMGRMCFPGDVVRLWPRYTEGYAALGPATEKLMSLQAELVDFCGHDITKIPTEVEEFLSRHAA